MTDFQNGGLTKRLALSRRRFGWRWVMAFGAALSATAACAADDLSLMGDIPMPHIQMPQVQVPSVDVDVRIGEEARPLPPPRNYSGMYPRNTYAAMPPARYERELVEHPGVPPQEVASMLRASGYSLLGQINRRGWVYTIAVLNPRGDDGRAVIDARTGSIIRFVPAMNVSARFDDELTTIYGPPGPPLSPPPIAAASYENRRGALLDLQRAPRPAAAVPRAAPKVASRNLTQPQPAVLKPVTPAPPVAAAPSKPANNAVAESKPAGVTTGTAPSSAPQSAASEMKLWPTQAMPDVQPLD